MGKRQVRSELSLSQEWDTLSRAMYGKDFIAELAELFKSHNVKTILECGCGGGHILAGLAERGFDVVGIDSDKEMIDIARKNYSKLKFELMNWLDLNLLSAKFDAVMCRGNSLTNVDSWFNRKLAPSHNLIAKLSSIKTSLKIMWGKVRKGGLLYIDTISQKEIDSNGGNVNFSRDGINLCGRIIHDWENRERIINGLGIVNGKKFSGGTVSYLIKPSEMKILMADLRPKPSRIGEPNLKNEVNYCVVCAKK